MPLSPLTLPKTIRDEMNVRLGMDGRYTAPEKINTDAVIPVYDLAEHGASGTPVGDGLIRGWVQSMIAWPTASMVLYSNVIADNPVHFCLHANKYLRYKNYYSEVLKVVAAGEGNEESSVWVEICLQKYSDPDVILTIARWQWHSFLPRPAQGSTTFILRAQSNNGNKMTNPMVALPLANPNFHQYWPMIQYDFPGEGLSLNQCIPYHEDYAYKVIIRWGDIFNSLQIGDELNFRPYAEHDPEVIPRNV